VFKKVLIANRGEIAVRVTRALHELGVLAVAVYSDADAAALHTTVADEAVRLGEAPAGESYLRADRIIEACRQTGAEAVHPGYGFLAEDPAFCEAVEAAGLTFIGPSAAAMRAMGEKTRARALMERSGVPVVPGAPAGTDAELLARASDVGFPLLVKAAAGGGGKGMRVVLDAPSLPDALRQARTEALRSFGDDQVYLERYLERPRHIEVQVLGLPGGRAVSLFERECSVQRRHQKVLEESPAPGVDEPLRGALCEAAVRAAEAVSYLGAGTVEFLLDQDGRFYFLEMNTRLQVEHPVTELVLGIDLVKAQLRIAAGEPLGFDPAALFPRGHAIEARVYAEDPARGFAPQAGAIHFAEPPIGPHVRVDAGVRTGSEVSVHYDPLLSKVIAWAPTREEAVRTLEEALARYVLLGPQTNLEYLQAVLRTPAFRAGRTHTWLLEEALPDWRLPEEVPDEVYAAAGLADACGVGSGPVAAGGGGGHLGAQGGDGDRFSPWQGPFALSGARLAARGQTP